MKMDINELPEETIVRQAASGDRAAFDAICRAYEGRLRTYITGNLSDRSLAEDVLQNTFIAAYKNIGSLRDAGGLRSWLHTIAYNECMDMNAAVRKDSERLVPLTDSNGSEREFEDDTLELPEDYAANAELRGTLTKMLNSLPKGRRDVLVLYYYKKKSIKEISETLGISENAVKLRKHDAIERLGRKMRKLRSEYAFSAAPVGLLIGKLAETGKVKSSYAGTAVVRSAGTGVIAACAAGVIGLGAIGILEYTDNRETLPDLPDSSCAEQDSTEDSEAGWQPLDLADRISAIRGSFYCDLIPQGAYTDRLGYTDPFYTKTLLEEEVKEHNALADSEHQKNYPVPPYIKEDSQEYRFLRLGDVQYKGETLRLVYAPYLSKTENFLNEDEGFAERIPQLTVNVGLTDEYTLDGRLLIEDSRVILEFDGVKDPEHLVTMEPLDKQRISSEFMENYDGSSDGEPEVLYTGLFDVKLAGYKTVYLDDDCFCVEDYHVEYTDINGPGWVYYISDCYKNAPLTAEIYDKMPNEGDNTFTFIIHADGSIHINKHMADPYVVSSILPQTVDPPYSSITIDEETGLVMCDGIFYSRENGELEVVSHSVVPYNDRHFDVLHLPDGYCTDNIYWLLLLDVDRFVLGKDSERFYNLLLSIAASDLNFPDDDIPGGLDEEYYKLLYKKEDAHTLLEHIDASQYGSGDLEADIAAAEPYYTNEKFYEMFHDILDAVSERKSFEDPEDTTDEEPEEAEWD